MVLGPSLLGMLLLGVPAGAVPQQEGTHEATFEHALEHHSIADLTKWREVHPWSLGDRLAGFLEGLLATRKAGERLANERASLAAAFLVEGIAEDPFSGWVLEVRGWDAEACSRHETVMEALASLQPMIAAGEGAAACVQIADLRDHLAPTGSWALCAPALARCAAGFLHAGDREHARQLASDLASSAEELKLGSVLAACERILGEIAREGGDLAECERRTSRCFEIEGQLDSEKRVELLGEIENLEAVEIDTLIEIAIGEKDTLVLVSGNRGHGVKLVPLGRAWIAEKTKHLRDPKLPFDEAAARELYDKLLLPMEPWLGARLGIVPDAILSSLPLELLVAGSSPAGSAKPLRFLARDHSIVHLSRPPLGGPTLDSVPKEPRTSGTLVIAGGSDPARSPRAPDVGLLAPVRTIRPRTPGDWAKEVRDAKTLHFDEFEFADPLESLRGVKLRADLAVLVDCRSAAKEDATPGLARLADAFHGAGVRDVLGNIGPASEAVLARFYELLAQGQPAADAMRAARAVFIDGPAETAHPSSWAAWVIHRRN